MSCIVYQTDKKTGIKYAYESFSYWDKEKKQPRSTRKYLGRVDPETGKIIYKEDKEEHSADATRRDHVREETENLRKEVEKRDLIIKELREELKKKEAENRKLSSSAAKAVRILEAVTGAEAG